MTQQTPTEFINALSDAAKAECQKNLRKGVRGSFGEGKAEDKLPDGRTVVCNFSTSTSIYGRDVARSSFTIDGKRASKEQIGLALGARTHEWVANLNPQLRAAFEAQAPELEKEYYDWIVRVFEYQNEKFNGNIPAYPSATKTDKNLYNLIRYTLSQYCDVVKPEGAKPWDNDYFLRLNKTTLAKKAKEYAEEAAVEWFYKTNRKLGKLEDAELLRDSGGDVVVRGTRDGKKIELNQQRILKTSVNGILFHQFPARLYVDSKFVTEAAYKKLFGDKE